jgi:hypothetical protein
MVDDEDDEREQPEEREDPENETFRIWRSLGRRDDFRRWPKPCSTCMLLWLGLCGVSELVPQTNWWWTGQRISNRSRKSYTSWSGGDS